MSRITTLDELMDAVRDRRAVVAPGTVFEKPRGAAWIARLQGTIIHRLFNYGLFLYERPEPTSSALRRGRSPRRKAASQKGN